MSKISEKLAFVVSAYANGASGATINTSITIKLVCSPMVCSPSQLNK